MPDALKHFRLLALLLSAATSFLPATASADPGVLRAEDLVRIGEFGWVATGFEMPKTSPALPLIDPGDTSPEAALLRRLENAGKASGFDGVLYDNRDRGHSAPPRGLFPRLPRLQFGKELRDLGMDYGLAGQIVLPAIVIGNSSTAINKGEFPRSQPRLAMTSRRGGAHAFLSYISDHLYVYPEHRDHDKVDVFPVNWPYMLISQGSSHSDKPFLRALFMTVAAFTPETRSALREHSLVAPTLQMILRRSQQGIYSREAYKSGAAHPVVFAKEDLAPERMVTLAASLKPEDIPPMVRLNVLEEEFATKAGLAAMSELLINSPSSIARVWRGPEYSKRMLLSAADTKDPNGRDLQFSWVLLQGDPERVRITPQDPHGIRAEIDIDWHDTFRSAKSEKRSTNRVDIGVFAWNGVHESAPAIISISFPGHQRRVYEPDPEDQTMRLTSIDYSLPGSKPYIDPLLHWTAPWFDKVYYDAAGHPVKWHRKSKDETLVLDTPNSMVDGRVISYMLEDTKKGSVLSMRIEPR